ncbi:MAG: hypothetical protein Q7U02_08690 [Desulfosalsimonadaceae bacterium]|nr:hypothetical protein [Desulfosalsimonadaceae bacterium]
MFLDQNLKSIQEAKARLAICCDLRRRLVQIEVQGIGYGVRRTISNLTLGLVVAEHIIGFLRERKGSRR